MHLIFGQYMGLVQSNIMRNLGSYWFVAIIPSRKRATARGLDLLTPKLVGWSFTFVCGQLGLRPAIGRYFLALNGLLLLGLLFSVISELRTIRCSRLSNPAEVDGFIGRVIPEIYSSERDFISVDSESGFYTRYRTWS